MTGINPFQGNAPFIFPLKMSESQGFSEVFMGIVMENWLEMS